MEVKETGTVMLCKEGDDHFTKGREYPVLKVEGGGLFIKCDVYHPHPFARLKGSQFKRV